MGRQVNHDEDDEPGHFTHRTVKASDAAAVATSAPRDVFTLGAGAAPVDAEKDDDAPRDYQRRVRAIEMFRQCGRLTSTELAVELGAEKLVTQRMVARMRAAGEIEKFKGTDGVVRYGLPGSEPPGNALGWSRPAPALQLAPGASSALEAQLTCGLMNTGELLIECGPQRIRLPKASVRSLVAYLDLVASAIAEA